MILPDGSNDAEQAQAKQAYAPVAPRPGETSGLTAPAPPPPSYDQSYRTTMAAYGDEYVDQEAGRAARWRFFRAFLVAGAIWLLLGMFTSSVADLAHGVHRYTQNFPSGGRSNGKVDIPSDVPGTIRRCADWSDEQGFAGGRYRRSTSFELPTIANAQFLVSRGTLSAGKVDVVPVPGNANGTIKVDVDILYWDASMLDQTNVCQMTRDDDEHGVGIFTPRYWRPRWPREQLEFHVRIALPVGEKSDTLKLNRFATDTHNFAHTLSDLLHQVDFRSLSLGTTNSAIHAESIGAERVEMKSTNGVVRVDKTLNAPFAKIETTNSAISGTFNSSDALDLHTTNGRIDVNVFLYGNTNTTSARARTTLNMRTTNSMIHAGVYLRNATASSTTHNAFAVDAHTTNERLELNFHEHPTDAPLALIGRTSNSRVEVQMHPAFEGSFSARTSNANVQVTANRVDDPSGRGRERQLNQSKAGKEARGDVAWTPSSGAAKGSVDLSTSNSPINLHF